MRLNFYREKSENETPRTRIIAMSVRFFVNVASPEAGGEAMSALQAELEAFDVGEMPRLGTKWKK